MTRKLIIAAFAAAAFITPALADDDKACNKTPREQWLTKDQISAKLAEQGYKIDKVEFDDGCVEVEGKDKDGKRVELELDAATAAIVEIDD